jgi:phage major head subunit gpT-like protein
MISPTNFNILVTQVQNVIGQAWVDTVPIMYDKVCQTIPSNSSQELYPWTGMLPKMRLWQGSRVVFEPAPQTYTLVNQPFESTLSVDRFTIDDDQYDYLWRILPDMARQAKRQPDYMMRDLLENSGDQTGTRQNGLDGLTAFNTAHPINFYNSNLGTYSNDFTGGGFATTFPKAGGGTSSVTVGGAFGVTGLMTAYEYMMTYKGEDNEALGIVPNTIIIHPLLKGEAEVILNNSFFAPPAWSTITGQVGTAENPFKRYGLEFIINPLLTQAYTWYIADTTRGFKPWIHQIREATKLVPRVNENDPIVFDTHTFYWGQWDRQAVGWGPSFLFARSGA